MVKRCSRNTLVICFVVTLLLTNVANGGEIHSLGGILQGSSIPIEKATVTLTDAVTFSVIDTTSSDADGLFLFNVDNGIYHLLITPPAGSEYRGVIISDIRVADKDVTQHVVLASKNDVDYNRIVTSSRSQFPLERVASNVAHTSKESSATDFLFLLPECSVGMCD